MYELTIKQKLTNYCYFLLINTGIATIISCRYLLACNNFQLDASTIFFWFSSHISYMLLMSLFVGIIGSLGFVFKSDNKQQLFQVIIVALALILLFVDTDVYIRNKSHLYIGYIPVYFVKTSFYLIKRPWFIFSIIFIPLLIYIEYYLIKWIAKQSWFSNKKLLVNTIGVSFICIALTKAIFYLYLPQYKQQAISHISDYIPKFTSNDKLNVNNINLINTIKYSLNYAKMLNLTTAEKKFNRCYEARLWGKGAGLYSGGASALENNLNLRNKLVEIVKDYNIKSILDGACGDFYWMNVVLPKLNLEKYIGGDIASYIIKQNKQNYNYNNVEFMQMDITKDKLPDVDLLMVRDVLYLLSYKDIKLFLSNFHASNIKYLLVSTQNKEQKYFNNKNVITGEHRDTNLFEAPFNFDKAKVKLTIIDSQGNGKEMILLSKEDVPKTF